VKNIHEIKRPRTRSKKVKALFLRKENVPEKVESVPKWNGEERVPHPIERCFFLKKELSLFWNAFFAVPILNDQERILLLEESVLSHSHKKDDKK